ncbi:hypothetical protein PpBr36_00853 [Pyricularia pennisetigena]|uniref:hypothetical protein n=1 Tax=Pyricularia pennisetigena TaxID=1578925 RepID=UPI0011528160|nr:hypothetical protein PpBr36_00853 [Pyricularia pennisetigena]TLS29678.1 hypothetical protein PpBr36_00853 [Pyricularia pennisetigena]
MTKLILSTGNIVSGGPSIIRKPGAFRSNLELTNSLRSNFLAAQEYYAAEAEAAAHNGNGNGNGIANGNGNGNGNGINGGRRRVPASIWTTREKMSLKRKAGDGDAAREAQQEQDEQEEVLYVPRIDWFAAGLQEEASQYDITAKLFFLPTAPTASRRRYAREALSLVLRELGVRAVDLLIVSFPGMSFEEDCEWEADKKNGEQGDDEEEAATWRIVEDLHKEGLVQRLGLSEFGSEKLARFLARKPTIRPAVDQINVKNCCSVPPPLAKLAKEQKIELLVHSDCTDILPQGTLRELLGPGIRGAGILASESGGDDEEYEGGLLRGEITPEWVIKYTAVVRDRGVIENKGYFAGAELRET